MHYLEITFEFIIIYLYFAVTIYPTEISFAKACPRIIVKVKDANDGQSYLKQTKVGSNLKKSKSNTAPIKIQETDEGKTLAEGPLKEEEVKLWLFDYRGGVSAKFWVGVCRPQLQNGTVG